VILACAAVDFQIHQSYFVVGHFHWVLIGGTLFGVFAGVQYWYPKVTGRMLSEKLAKWHFWLFLVGFHLCFDTMHIPGLLGMPRRIYTYEPGRGWAGFNVIVGIGAALQGIAVLIFAVNLIRSARKGKPAGNDPWDAWTLEWTTSSPPPDYNFATQPVVKSRRPLWDLKHPEDPDWRYE